MHDVCVHVCKVLIIIIIIIIIIYPNNIYNFSKNITYMYAHCRNYCRDGYGKLLLTFRLSETAI